MQVDFLGIKTRVSYLGVPEWRDSEDCSAPSLPRFDDQYLEWIDLLEAISEARNDFTMMELGAGYGRWLVRATSIARSFGNIPCKLVGVEAEPTHFEWMCQHFSDNGLSPADHLLIRGAVSTKDGTARFLVGNPGEWYGQRMAKLEDQWERIKRPLKQITSKPASKARSLPRYRLEKVRTVSLNTLLASLQKVDLIDLDVQGSELEVLAVAALTINEKVGRVHTGTHNRRVEAGLRSFFSRLEWISVFDFPGQSEHETPWGPIEFQDGVQSWVNPRFQRNE